MIGIDVALGVLYLFLGLLLIRFVVDWVQVLSRSWRPRGAVASLLEIVYSITDPPVKGLRRVLPPLRFGAVALDLSFMIIFIAVIIAIQVLSTR